MAISILPPATLRVAHRYAPDAVKAALTELATAPVVALVLDIDTLERSALARLDRVMLLALGELARAGVRIVLTAEHARERARLVQRSLDRSLLFLGTHAGTLTDVRGAIAGARLLVVSDDPTLVGMVTGADRALAVGRPELIGPTTCSIGDASIRAALWFLLEQRHRWQVAQ